MVMKTGGTVNFEEDDNQPARYEWSIVSQTNANMIQNSLVRHYHARVLLQNSVRADNAQTYSG